MDFNSAISGIESGGNYGLLGPYIPKLQDQAYGKYQVMGTNIPGWTAQYYGQKLTPAQFLHNPQAQEAVFNGKFGEYVNKYGPEGAAKAWFAGERGMNNPNAKDPLGTSVADYARKFNSAALIPGTQAPPLPPPINVGSLPIPQAQAPQFPAAPQQQQQQQKPQQQPQFAGGGQQQMDPLQQAFLAQMFNQRPVEAQPVHPQVNLAPLQQVMAQFKFPSFLG